ncbi:MAG: glycosyltransferase, partial [Bdellovibrionales bacterium]|nr:glycosyltransferase [Bdellovibrionales bacterium]
MKAHLQIVIPAYNEASRIGATIENLMAELSKRTEHIQVLVVLNGCKDDTLEVVESYRKLYPDKIIVQDHREPLGKGRAIIHGFKMCTAEYVSFMDADGSVSASSVLSLLDRIGQYDAAIGSRRCDGAKILVKQPWPRHVAGRAYAWLTRLLLGLPFCDTQCGGKIFKKEVADVIASNCTEYGWAFDVAMLDIILLKGFTVKELPIIWTNDDRSKIKLFKDGFQMLKSLLRLRYSKRTVEYKNVLMLQHHFINQGTYKRCYKFAEHLASQARHISIVCVDTKMNGFWP